MKFHSTMVAKLRTLLFVMITCGTVTGDADARRKEVDRLLQGYDRTIRPHNYPGEPVMNKVQLYILSINSISELHMEYQMSMFLRQKWNDSRLMYTPIDDNEMLELDPHMVDRFWVPDLYVINEKKADFHYITVPNNMMLIYPDGLVYLSRRVTGTYSCHMHLVKFPVDTQYCKFEMESYGHSTKSLDMVWHNKPVVWGPDLMSPQFNISDITSYRCDKLYSGVNYTCIGMKIKLTRNYGYYLIQVYVPTTMIVMLSWVSLWISVDGVAARTSLGLLTVLTMTTISNAARSELPRVSYIKAMDVWLAMCLMFVFAAFVEFAYVNVISRVEQRRRSSVLDQLVKTVNGDFLNGDVKKENEHFKKSVSSQTLTSTSGHSSEVTSRQRARRCDKISRILFPMSFFVFNGVYWPFYLLWQPTNEF